MRGSNDCGLRTGEGAIRRRARVIRRRHNAPASVPGQSDWRWCKKCQGLHFGGNNAGVCPAGGGHDKSQSGNYKLGHNSSTAMGQSDWRWCSKCAGLHFGGHPPGPCPAGGTHVKAGSGNYTLFHR